MSWIKENTLSFIQLLALKVVKTGHIPKHIAFIMDGNRRYADKRKVCGLQGHSKGFDKLAEVLQWCLDLGIREVTVYAFSIENFKRSKEEVDGLMQLAKEKFQRLLDERDKLMEHGVRVRVIGNLSLIPEDVRKLMAESMLITMNNDKALLNIAFAYTSRDEITEAVRAVVSGVKNNDIIPEDINEELITKSLYTHESPEPDLLIRSSAEVRFSDFLLWQISYACVYFAKPLWPEFSIWDLLAAIFHFQRNYDGLRAIATENRSKQAIYNNRVIGYVNGLGKRFMHTILAASSATTKVIDFSLLNLAMVIDGTMAAEKPDVAHDILEARNDTARNLFYKKPIKKDNYKLDIDDEDCPQEVRRQQLLSHQKKSRDAAFNAGRAILEAAMDSEKENLEEMEVCKKSSRTFQRCRQYANKLMMSEWMLEVPEDYLEKWLLVPCPEGRRSLVVACKGKTRAYSKRGERLGSFNSSLPGGNSREYKNSCTILDCIWLRKKKMYYVLDVLAWSNQPLLNCDAEFRMFWLKSQFDDIKELQCCNTPRNTFPILPLPYVACNENTSEFMEKLSCIEPLDGVLFFHREGQYTSGRTPLVTWLKPFMLEEVLGISVPPCLAKKPDRYIDFQHYIQSSKSVSKEKVIDNEMDVQDIET